MLTLIKELGLRQETTFQKWGLYKCSKCGSKKPFKIAVINHRLKKNKNIHCACGRGRKKLPPEVVRSKLLEKENRRIIAVARRNDASRVSIMKGRWRFMMMRCYDEANGNYKSYGARGITVCKRWHKFENFLKDMVAPPFHGAELDRINGKKGYSPKNVRWATRLENQQNRLPMYRPRPMIVDGHRFESIAACARHFNIKNETAIRRCNTQKKGFKWAEEKSK